MDDFSMRRRMMVDTQVRPSDVSQFPIIEAMLTIPREQFVPNAFRSAAYLGDPVTIGSARTILDPRAMSKMLSALSLGPKDLVLDLGPGFGYSTAVVAHVAQAVVGVEPDETLATEAQAALAENGIDNATIEVAPLTQGAPAHGPYDAIVIQGAIERLPDAIADQLAEGGRIIAIWSEGRLGVARLGIKVDGRINWRYAFNAGAPVLPGFETTGEFQF